MKKDNELLDEYIQNCMFHHQESLKGNYSKSDFYIKKNIKILKRVKNSGNLEIFLTNILNGDNIYAKCSAAIEAIKNDIFIEKSINILEKLSILDDEQYKNVSFNARWFLKSIIN